MGLEAPWALLGALLAAGPIIAHLVRRRDLPRIALPTIALLRRAQVASQRRTRIVDLLLLLVRVALIVTITVAVASPYRTIALAYGDGARATVALVIDDSLSMSRTGAAGDTPYAAAISRAREVLSALPAGSEAAVVLAGHAPRVLVPRTGDLAAAAQSVAELGATPPTRGTALAGALPLALRELAGSRFEARRVLVLTDGAAHAHADALEMPPNVALTVERFGPAAGGAAPVNVAITSVTAVPDPTAPRETSVLVELRASGTAPASVLPLLLERAGVVVARAEVSFSGGVARITMHAPFAGADDDPTARVRVDANDVLPADDVRGALLRQPSSLRVLVVGDGNSAQPVAQALTLIPAREGVVDARVIDADTLATVDLSAYDAVLLAGTPAPSAATALALCAFVEHGGGLIVAAGESLEARALDAALGSVLPARPRGVAPADPALGVRAGETGGALVDATGLSNAVVRQRLLFEAPRSDAQVPLRFSDGTPALLVGRAGQGQVALLATSLDESLADLPLRPGYLPLIARLVREVSPAARAPEGPVLPGDTVRLTLPPGAERLVVTRPDGERESFDGPSAAIGATTLLGAYRVEVADRGGSLRDAPRLAFVVAAPPSESDLTPGPEAASTSARSGEQRATATSVKRSLAPWLFFAVGLLAIAEGALRFRWRRAPTTA